MKTEHEVLKDLSVRGFVALREYYDQMSSAIDGGFWQQEHDEIRKGISRYADMTGLQWITSREGLAAYFHKQSLKKTNFYLTAEQKKTLKQVGSGSLARGLERLLALYEEMTKNGFTINQVLHGRSDQSK